MHSESADRLPITEDACRALVETYERQWCETRRVCEEQRALGRDDGVAAAAHGAALRMRRLWAEASRLHERLCDAAADGTPSFTPEERRSLRLLGFRSPPPSPPPPSDAAPPPLAPQPPLRPYDVAQLAALRADCTQLRQRNAELLGRLAWYELRDAHAAGGEEEKEKAGTTALSARSAPAHASDAYRQLAEVQHHYKRLFSSRAAQPSRTPSPYARQAEDTAIDALVRECAFPCSVRVERVGPDGLFLIDRPVWIEFASPQSSVLIVRDPDAVEPACTLESYLTALYAPLLQAVGRRGSAARAPEVETSVAASIPSAVHTPEAAAIALPTPALSTPALSQLTYAELVELKRAALLRLQRSGERTTRSDSVAVP
ncbi:hypothetical protein NESM_000176100 [Novymonas esmeraldas]|uniref:Uncharacterized protein n=1 Tax=Novymonas esmeraldas TaxID=1808958 RepID=A0AAW0F5Q9_9TRYP